MRLITRLFIGIILFSLFCAFLVSVGKWEIVTATFGDVLQAVTNAVELFVDAAF